MSVIELIFLYILPNNMSDLARLKKKLAQIACIKMAPWSMLIWKQVKATVGSAGVKGQGQKLIHLSWNLFQ